MSNTGPKFCTIMMVCFMVFCFSTQALSEISWLNSLKNTPVPERIELSQTERQQVEAISLRAVRMRHATFLLDRAYIPQIEKATGHILLQLTETLNADIERKLEDYGVKLLEYIPDNTWKAAIPAAAVQEVKALDFVHAMGDIHPVDKFPKHVLIKDFYRYSYHPDGTISLLVSFHKGISFNRVKEILAELSGTTLQQEFITGHRILMRIPQQLLQDLAEYDEVNWIEDRPTPKIASNVNAAALSNINDVGVAPYNLDGSGIRIGEWDVGEVEDVHADLVGRVFVIDTGGISAHATHVAGTMIGDGSTNAEAKGMAPAATLYSYDSAGDELAEMSSAATLYEIELANHSWGPAFGWELCGGIICEEDKWMWFDNTANFGRYMSDSQNWDQTVIDTGLIIIYACGNDRGHDGDEDQTGHYHAPDFVNEHIDFHAPDPDYTSIDPISVSKNIINVGAVDDTGGMSSFSSWGPPEDGRVKPDIVANGVGLTSTWPAGIPCPPDDTYETHCSTSGTSMAAPAVTGAIALIVQRYKQVFGDAPSPAMVKALIINTASELGTIGPDYRFGWGLLDAKAAIDLIDEGDTYLKTDSLSNAETREYSLNVSSASKVLKVSVAWTDPAASPSAEMFLENDIDLKLIDPFGGIHEPWLLDKDQPELPASRDVNTVDNVEQVLVNFPQEGAWTIRATGTSIQGSQSFALAISLLEEFQVNTYSNYFQEFPSVAGLSGGGFVVTWDSRSILLGSTDVYGQLFDSAGNPNGDEFQVNTYITDNQENSSVAGLSGGGFVVTWESKNQDGNNYGVYGQRFDSAGNQDGDEFQVNTHTLFRQEHPSVAALSGGGFVVAWDSDIQDGSSDGVYGQVFNSAGNPVGDEFQVNTYTTSSQTRPSAAGLPGGGFVVAWESSGQDESGFGIYGQVFESDGDPVGDEFQVNTYTMMSQMEPSVAALYGGDFAVTWESYEQDGSGDGIYGKVFDSAGDPVGDEFQVSTYSEDDQQYPSVAPLSSGGFVVTWESNNQDGNIDGIFGQLFDNTGNPNGDEFQVNTYAVHSQDSPSVAQLPGSGYVVTWQSTYQDGDASGIFAKRFMTPQKCDCDFNEDNDVDGADLVAYIADPGEIGLGDFAAEFGRVNCQN